MRLSLHYAWTALRERLFPESVVPFAPDFSDSAFIGALGRDLREKEFQAALVRYQMGDSVQARGLIVKHFRNRQGPRFFVEYAVVRLLVERVGEEFPLWRSRTVERALNDLEVGLPVYAAVAPRLDEDFPWGAPCAEETDSLYQVRPHRFAFAPRMALASLYGVKTFSRLEKMLDSWMMFTARSDSSLSYLSTLVVVQRILALSWAWTFVAAAAQSDEDVSGTRLQFTILKILYSDVRFLATRVGQAFPNNHLLADAFAGWYVGFLFPEFLPDPRFLHRCEALWHGELDRQILEDGTSFEHALHYHEFACEMVSAYIVLRNKNGLGVEDWILRKAEKMLYFQSEIGGREGLPVAFGNATEDPLFPLDGEEAICNSALRALYRRLFNADYQSPLPGSGSTERAFWLLSGDLCNATGQTADLLPPLREFPHGGFFIFSEPETDTRLTFRTGPTRGAPIAPGHMHADLLAVYLTSEARPLVVDAGTFSYRNQSGRSRPNWRSYLAGPQAHSGPCLDDVDPFGTIDGDFRDKEVATFVAQRKVLPAFPSSLVEAMVEGSSPYKGLRRGVVHIRGQYWLAYDLLPDAIAAGSYSVSFQFAPGTEANLVRGSVQAGVGSQNFVLTASDGVRCEGLFRGETDPPAGWVSPAYGLIQSAPQVRYSSDRRQALAFLIQCGSPGFACESLEVLADTSVLSITARGNEVIDRLLVNLSPSPSLVSAQGLEFDGDSVWLRTRFERLEDLRWLNGRSLDAGFLGVGISASRRLSSLRAFAEEGEDPQVVHGDSTAISHFLWPKA